MACGGLSHRTMRKSYNIRTYANWTNIGIFNPLNPPYQGDFKAECVSPKRNTISKQ